MILFADPVEARSFVTRLSATLIQEVPDLDLVAAHVPVDWEGQPLGDPEVGRVRAVMDELERVKRTRTTSAPLLGVGVTTACESTGLVAVTEQAQYGYSVSAGVSAKWAHAPVAEARLLHLLPQIEAQGLDVPRDFDDFGRSEGEKSYIAVVHADGNGMAQRVRAIADQCADPGPGNRDYVEAMRSFSSRIEAASRAALSATVDTLLTAVSKDKLSVSEQIEIRDRKLPFRPLVFGGDDVTFVCDGRLGLGLAARYLQAFEEETAKVKIPAFACAGVSVVKTHYPFARAYGLAEELCSEAKKHARSMPDIDFSVLDWHFAASGLLGRLRDIREWEYRLPNGDSLTMRPVRLRPLPGHWRTWDNFHLAARAFQKGSRWADKRNKVMKLRTVLRGGAAGVRQFIAAYDDIEQLPTLQEQSHDLDRTGWDGKICAYFDPIEAMDFYLPLSGK